MTDPPSSWLVDLHGATSLYAGGAALTGIAARATDLLWSELPQLRSWIDVVFGYGLLLLLAGGHLLLRWRPRQGAPLASAGLVLLASLCASQLLGRGLGLAAYTVYEGDAPVTLLTSLALLAALQSRSSSVCSR